MTCPRPFPAALLITLLAACGARPTGDEIVSPGEPVGPNQVVSANAMALAAFVTAEGGVPVDPQHVVHRDDVGVLDPGLGFSKRTEHSVAVLRRMAAGLCIVVGLFMLARTL